MGKSYVLFSLLVSVKMLYLTIVSSAESHSVLHTTHSTAGERERKVQVVVQQQQQHHAALSNS